MLRKRGLYKREKEKYRVLDMKDNKVCVIDCIKKTMPVWIKETELLNYVEESEECIVDDTLEDVDAAVKKIIYQRYAMVSPILPFIANKVMRSEAIKMIAEENNVTKQTVRKYLCEYLSTYDIRSLAPRERQQKTLCADEKVMRKSLNKWYYTTKKRTLKTVYTLMLQNYYCDTEGRLLEEYPSLRQFRYFFHKYNQKEKELISRENLSCYQRNCRPLVGNGIQSFASNIGTGMLDATICDIYLVNETGGIVGRPVLTACIDVFSGICMGYSLSWQGGIYSLRDLMLNIVTDKVEHCKSFGIDISQEEWPCRQLPLKFVTDMGSEYKGSTFSQIADLGVEVVNLPAYRPDLKGCVEKFFDTIQNYYKPYLKGKGVIEPDYQERGVMDYRKQACLTLADFEAVILHCIIFYNSKRVLENYPFTDEMIESGVKPYPHEIWKYGRTLDGVNLMDTDKQTLVMALLPRANAKFTRKGLYVNGLHYHNHNYREQYLNGKECVTAYNPDDVSKAWLLENGSYICFDLIETRFADKNLEEAGLLKQKQRELVKKEKEIRIQAEIDLANHIHIIADRTSCPGCADIKNIRANRNREQAKAHKDFVKEAGIQ